MAEIRVEQKQRSILSWIIGLVLLALVIVALTNLMDRNERGAVRDGAAAAETQWDNTPPHLRQYA